MKALVFQIQNVVFNVQENNTCYFQNSLRLLKCFQNYLLSFYAKPQQRIGQPPKCDNISFIQFQNSSSNIKLFAEKISLKQLSLFPQSVQILNKFRFIDLNHIQKNRNNLQEFYQKTRLIQAIFVIYIICEHSRQKSLRQVCKQQSRQAIGQIQVETAFQQAQQFISKLIFRSETQMPNHKLFDINQQKLLKLLLIKSLEIKLKKSNQTYCNKETYSIKLEERDKKHFVGDKDHKNKFVNNKMQDQLWHKEQVRTMLKNQSIVTIKSQYFDDHHKNSRLKQNFYYNSPRPFDFKLQFQQLNQEDLFEYVNLDY